MSPQQTIAHYRVTARIGAGGMGEVWRATDTRLNRDVAIKFLPEAFANDTDRMARFQREAQVLASLNHPNIAAIYGVEERALVMELVEGPTLAEQIERGPMAEDEVLPLLHQMVDALEYAHEKGVVHRDLKPANIKITSEGRVKILDFGLAKALTPGMAADDPASSPTLTMRATVAGTILGTAAYMAPEQARGHNVDKRADIWAFGVVVYEMLAGRQLFGGPTVSDTLAAVLTREPDWELVPVRFRRLLRLCLAKDPHQRLRDIGDARALVGEGAEAEVRPAVPPVRRGLPVWAGGLLAVALVIAGGGWWRATRPVLHPLTRLSVDLGPDAITGINLTAAISPDGRRLVFAARGPDGKPRLATRLLDQEQAILLPGTENGSDPFFSPDGQWVGFFADGKLKKISVEGGAPLTLCHAGIPRGGSWGEDGDVVLNVNLLGPLFRVSSAGGVLQPLTRLRTGESSHRWPQILPGGQAVLFTASPSAFGQEAADIQVLSLKTGQVKIVQRGGYYGRYLPSGHLVFVHQGVLFGARFDTTRLEERGTPTPLLQNVAANGSTGGGQFDFTAAPSGAGTFLYLAGQGVTQNWQMVWLESSGKQQPLISAPGLYAAPRLSPDGRKVAFSSASIGISVYELDRDATTRITFDDQVTPVWTPDGRHIVFSSRSGALGLGWVRSDGSGEPRLLLEGQNLLIPWSVSPDGKFLAYYDSNVSGDLWILPLDITDPDRPKPGTPRPFLRTPADERYPRFSPDGRWIAYRSNESGTEEIYVRPFPGPGGKWQVSAGGGVYALWSKNGRELFYETADGRIMVVDYTVDRESFIPGKPRLWSDRRISFPGVSNLDLAPDGKRFAVFTQPETTGGEKGSVHITMLLNYFDELRRKLP